MVESDRHVLVGVRADGVDLAGHHEFPGGKCESDETPRACVVRECREETGLVVVPREHLVTTTHEYEHARLEIHFWRCVLSPDLPDRAAARNGFQWVPLTDLNTLQFPAANEQVLKLLAASASGP